MVQSQKVLVLQLQLEEPQKAPLALEEGKLHAKAMLAQPPPKEILW
jgi:hypothetical protein